MAARAAARFAGGRGMQFEIHARQTTYPVYTPGTLYHITQLDQHFVHARFKRYLHEHHGNISRRRGRGCYCQCKRNNSNTKRDDDMQKPFTCPIGMPCIRKGCYDCENIGRGGQEKGFHISVTKRLHDCWEKVCNAASGDNAYK